MRSAGTPAGGRVWWQEEPAHSHSTVWKVLHRHGLSRRPRQPRDAARRYEWPCPGDLLHMDTARYARFERPGHRVTGDRSQHLRGRKVETLVGYDFAHAILDDHSRLAYVELHADERAPTITGFVERALAWFDHHGIEAKRLMTDNAWTYARNRSLRELLASREIKVLARSPTAPRRMGEVERFHQTMGREWAYGMSYRSHRHRNKSPARYTGLSTTTRVGRTAESATGHPSAAFTTYVGRTTRNLRSISTADPLRPFASLRRSRGRRSAVPH